MTRITPERLSSLRELAETFRDKSMRELLDAIEASYAELDALRAQLAERCVVVGPDEVVVGREEWAALGQIVTLVNKHINDPCYLRNQLVPIVDKASALRSGDAGKEGGGTE